MIGFYAAQMRVAGGAGGDPLWSSVRSLINFDQPNGSTTFTDATGRGWTRLSNAGLMSTTQARFGTASYYADTDNLFAGFRESSASSLHASGNFTVECFIRPNNVASRRDFFSVNGSSGYDINLFWRSGAVGYGEAGAESISPGGSAPHSAWTHVALVRISGVLHLFVGGQLVGTHANGLSGTSGSMQIGFGSGGGNSFRGYIDEFRATAGHARYSAAFTPPSAPFPAS